MRLLGISADIVSAYVTRNHIPATEIPRLLSAVHTMLNRLETQSTPMAEKPVPPVPIRRTVTPDHIISLENGKPYKTLIRHLAAHGLTPEQYRQKWSLPHDYPMIAENYAASRSNLSRASAINQPRCSNEASAGTSETDELPNIFAPESENKPEKPKLLSLAEQLDIQGKRWIQHSMNRIKEESNSKDPNLRAAYERMMQLSDKLPF
ncbi:MucR family transcriptional regulator [Methylobacterium nonmethylotrophicum]